MQPISTRMRSASILSIMIYTVSISEAMLARSLPTKPNFIIVLADDTGYGDLQSFGHPVQERNGLDQMASEGMLLRSFYAADSICSPSRAALLTGRYPARVGIYSANDSVTTRALEPTYSGGLPREEYTIAEALQDLGYYTGMVGKWHLGINRYSSSDGYYLPKNHGFDWVGLNLPHSNLLSCEEIQYHYPGGPSPSDCYLYEGDVIIQQPFNLENLTERMLSQSLDFISAHAREPFFLYMSMPHTHVSLVASERFAGKSKRGVYGDCLNEMGWAVGELLDHLRDLEIDGNTLVLFTSDNGPLIEMCEEGGDPGILTGGKAYLYEGGIRVPTIAWMPGHISPSISTELATHLDIYPTIIQMAGGDLSDHIVYDGTSLVSMLFDGATTPHDFVFHYCSQYLFAVRKGPYKVVYRTHELPSRDYIQCSCPLGFYMESNCHHTYNRGCVGDGITIEDPPLIYDIEADPRELFRLPLAQHMALLADIDEARAKFDLTFELGDPVIDWPASCDLVPCCNSTNIQCECNYETTTGFTEGDCF